MVFAILDVATQKITQAVNKIFQPVGTFSRGIIATKTPENRLINKITYTWRPLMPIVIKYIRYFLYLLLILAVGGIFKEHTNQ
jgi:hypothetical protein